MRTPIAFSFVITFLIISTQAIAQEQITHTITLHVDTGQVTSQNTAETCTFGQEGTISNEDYTTEARIGDIIVWQGVSSTAAGTDRVEISSINYQGGTNVFGRNVLRDNGQNPGVVLGVITQGSENDEMKYVVNFKVWNGETRRNGTFHIDPKILIKN